MLYHIDVFWPARILKNLPFGPHLLEYGKHAIKESLVDRYGTINLPRKVNLNNTYIFEAEEKVRGRINKFVFRLPLDSDRDLVMVVIPKGGRILFVKTVWINLNNDNHPSLDRSRYCSGIV